MPQIRPGVYRLGDTVQMTGIFFKSNDSIMDVRFGLITIKKPPPDNSVLGPFPVNFADGVGYFDFDPDIIGKWKVRLECSSPKSTVIESSFEVVPAGIN